MNNSRRNFLQSTVAAGVALATGSVSVGREIQGKRTLIVREGESVVIDQHWDVVEVRGGVISGIAKGGSIDSLLVENGRVFFTDVTIDALEIPADASGLMIGRNITSNHFEPVAIDYDGTTKPINGVSTWTGEGDGKSLDDPSNWAPISRIPYRYETQELIDDSVLPPTFMSDYFSERVKEEFNL